MTSTPTPELLEFSRLTGDGKYTDKLTFHLEGRSDNRCALYGCSESQVTSIKDFSTNCCNLRMLYCGADKGCRNVKHELEAEELEVDKSLGAGMDWDACFPLLHN
eukprot:CAMPEP_0194764742 /NCGR_PEP_ID=MMETSP0323_2-20130528/23713_1 /TAXON_ID=2866 ORGANISM="Crypthecodinium cohnii, Strain Seligo" /NCGR_SAMPLE_ID=MMETSP0323_2 /ASSEMBLY_ACC=CAM_ASM_000346 /LENGTH=104 /DNA_ID=CAMNT_0039692625 /DNA_START=240 /DNA_END=554 /DNA_ORIENTATION=-